MTKSPWGGCCRATWDRRQQHREAELQTHGEVMAEGDAAKGQVRSGHTNKCPLPAFPISATPRTPHLLLASALPPPQCLGERPGLEPLVGQRLRGGVGVSLL